MLPDGLCPPSREQLVTRDAPQGWADGRDLADSLYTSLVVFSLLTWGAKPEAAEVWERSEVFSQH